MAKDNETTSTNSGGTTIRSRGAGGGGGWRRRGPRSRTPLRRTCGRQAAVVPHPACCLRASRRADYLCLRYGKARLIAAHGRGPPVPQVFGSSGCAQPSRPARTGADRIELCPTPPGCPDVSQLLGRVGHGPDLRMCTFDLERV